MSVLPPIDEQIAALELRDSEMIPALDGKRWARLTVWQQAAVWRLQVREKLYVRSDGVICISRRRKPR